MAPNTHLISRGALLLSVALLASGCSATPDSAATDPQLSAAEVTSRMLTTPAPEPLWTAPAQTVGNGPVIAGDTAVTNVFRDGSLTLVGYDLRTGTEKWARAGVTGTRSATLPVDPRLFTDSDGTVLAANLLPAVETDPNGDGNTFWKHPVEVIDVESGKVLATSEPAYWIGPSVTGCMNTELSCAIGVNHGSSEVLSLGILPDATVIESPSTSTLPEFSFIDREGSQGILFGETSDGVPSAGRYIDGKLLWTVPLSELGITDPQRAEKRVGYDNLLLSAELYGEDGVAVLGGRYAPLDEAGNSTGEMHSVGVDAETGEVLWSKPGNNCFPGVMCFGDVTHQSENGSYTYLPADLTLAGLDPRTGESTWSAEVAGLTFANTDTWEAPGSAMQLINLAEGTRLLDVSTGEISKLTEKQHLLCRQQGTPYSLPGSSKPTNPNEEWTGNYVAGSCTSGKSGAATDPGAFSQAVVAAASAEPFGTTNWDALAPQVRIIATRDGIAAYEF